MNFGMLTAMSFVAFSKILQTKWILHIKIHTKLLEKRMTIGNFLYMSNHLCTKSITIIRNINRQKNVNSIPRRDSNSPILLQTAATSFRFPLLSNFRFSFCSSATIANVNNVKHSVTQALMCWILLVRWTGIMQFSTKYENWPCFVLDP